MRDFLYERLGESGQLTREICQEFGLKSYDPAKYHELETLGNGALGWVKKCKYIPIYEFHAVKTVDILTKKREKMISRIASYLVEAIIPRNFLNSKIQTLPPSRISVIYLILLKIIFNLWL